MNTAATPIDHEYFSMPSRIARFLFAKGLCAYAGYGAAMLTSSEFFVLFAFPLVLALYLLLTAILGWNPLRELEADVNQLARQPKIRALKTFWLGSAFKSGSGEVLPRIATSSH